MIGTKQIIKCALLCAKILNDIDIGLDLICKPGTNKPKIGTIYHW